MGYYIDKNSKGETLQPQGKTQALLTDGAKIVSGKEFVENLICVVQNGFFDAAGFVYSEAERKVFSENDGRRKIWLVHPMAKELSGYKK